MREMTLEEVKLLELDALKFIDSVCKENGLIYFAAYGTLLGAIRHKGFIPWDDDIDIYMPRPDFIKFVEVINNYEHPYSIRSLNDKDYFHAFAKLSDDRTYLIEKQFKSKSRELGVYVDIFILDGLPDDIKKHRSILKNVIVLQLFYMDLLTTSFQILKTDF